MIRYYSFTQGSPQWHTYQRGRWTGSTAIDLLEDAQIPPESDSDYDNKNLQHVRILEKLAIEAYEKEVDKLGETVHFGFITNSKYKHAGYSPDGVLGDTLLEVKCLIRENHQKLSEPMPADYMAQIQFGLLISELPKAVLIGYNPDSPQSLFAMEIEADPAIQANLVARLKATEPKRKPSQTRAGKRYIENNSIKIKAARHKRYIKNKMHASK